LQQQIAAAIAQLQPNDPNLQSEFTLQMVEVVAAGLALPMLTSLDEPDLNPASCDLVVAIALQQQVEQERLLNQVATQIRQSMELPVILQTAVQQVQTLLQADRVVLYEFSLPVAGTAPDAERTRTELGTITYEARANDRILSVLSWQEGMTCFADVPDFRTKYRQGMMVAIADVFDAFAHSPCLCRLLEQAQVRSKLVVPIVVQEELWGLLIAHQCTLRQWQAQEKSFLQRISEHLAIAIHQASLYAQLQSQKQTLAQHVAQRTQELYDALTVAQSASLAKTEFLSTMSHELRSPLTSIIGMTTTLLRLPVGAQGERLLSPARQRDYLRTIHASGEHLLQLINDILDLSEVEAGRMILDVQAFSLARMAKECVRSLQEKAEQTDISLNLEIQMQPQDAGVVLGEADTFTADPQRVRQILFNLLSNAIKFTPAGGQVTLRLWREQNLAVFQVEDTGIGIAESQLPLLFEKFQQLDMSRDRSYEGTGLGLALTKQLVELHRGWIEVDSTVNVGSTFTVWLPPQPLASRTELARPPIETPIHQGRIVVIEHDEETATLICDLLTTAGYQVVWILEGSTAASQIAILHPIAVLLGTNLLGMNAYEILQQLRHTPETQPIPILILDLANSVPEAEWVELGANAVWGISIAHPEKLLAKVATLVAEACDRSEIIS
jgi:two-component system sensor histidine kinase/response regulator